jgi:hypothetical protein
MILVSFVDISGYGAIDFGFTERIDTGLDFVLVLWNGNFPIRTNIILDCSLC